MAPNPNVATNKFVMRVPKSPARTSHDRIRYARDRLLEFRDACTEALEELVNSRIEGLTASPGAEDEWTRREPKDLSRPPAAWAVESDNKDWKAWARAPSPVPMQEDRSLSRDRERERNPQPWQRLDSQITSSATADAASPSTTSPTKSLCS